MSKIESIVYWFIASKYKLHTNYIQTMNQYTVGDNLVLLQDLKDQSVDFIYMDPPYNTGRNFHYFDDKFKTIEDFKVFIKSRIVECYRVLKNTGSIVVHIEPKISHHIRYICDEVFGGNNFRNEIVLHSGGNSKNKHQLGRNHDTLVVYSKSKAYTFTPLYKDYNEAYKSKLKTCKVSGRLYSTSACHNSQPEVNPRPNLRYEWKGYSKQWYVSLETMETLDKENRLEYNSKGIPRIKRYMDEMEGIPVRDTWDDIPSIQSKEKLPYATQKPVKLLERLLLLYTHENGVCLDPFAGSGTLGRACINLNRSYILFDLNLEGQELFLKSIL
jgi:DNA modification methylase